MFIAIDFGASRIKSIFFKNTKKILKSYETKGSIFFDKKGLVDKYFFKKSLFNHIKFYENFKFKVKKIIISSEMHGYAIWDGKKLTDYYSWRYKKNTREEIENKNFVSETGIKLREGIPYLGIKKIKKKVNVIGIAEIICLLKDGKYFNSIHSTYAQSLGIYNVEKGNNLNLRNELNSINKNISIKYNYFNFVGYTKKKNSRYMIYGGFADLQCAISNKKFDSRHVIINLGTGSQIISFKKKKFLEFRIGFLRKIFGCVTHIPSGRYFILIQKYFKLNESMFFRSLKRVNFNYLLNIKNKNSLFKYDLKSYYEYLKKNKINKCDFEEIAFIYLIQYIKILKRLNFTKITLTGGIPIKFPWVKSFLKHFYLTNKIKVIVDKKNTDETLIFMQKKYINMTQNDQP